LIKNLLLGVGCRYFPDGIEVDVIEDDVSVDRVKVAQQETIVGTLDECFEVYTQEERVYLRPLNVL